MPVRRLRPPLTLSLGLSLALGLGLNLGGCLPVAAIPGAVIGAAGLYCAAVSDAGKSMARDALTGGVPLIACPGASPAHPRPPQDGP